MLTRIMPILLAATLAGGYLTTVVVAVLLAAAAPAIAQRSSTTLDAWRLSNFGPSSASIGQANPGVQHLARPTDPNQIRSLPGLTAPSQTLPLGANGAATTPNARR
jgi:hypothetical protein